MRHLIWTSLALLALASLALPAAESIDLELSTPAIQKVRTALKAREEQLAKFRDNGQIGEGKDGLLAARSLEGLSLADKKTVEDLVAADNADRKALYRELLLAHGMKEEESAQVMILAAQARRKSAAPGHWVQEPRKGEWKLAREVKE